MEDNQKTNRKDRVDEAVTKCSDVQFSDSMYREIVDSPRDLIWQWDTEGRYVVLNKAWQKVFGYRTEKMLGRRFTDFICPKQAEADLATFSRSLDENQFSQVFDNLITNARQAVPTGGRLRVTAENVSLGKGTHPTLQQGEYIRITVADTGVGIPPEILPNIFEPFFSTKKTGSGLGLAIAHSIVLRHDGAFEVTSTAGAGPVFTIHLPVVESELTAESPLPEENAVEAFKESAVHFLIMDDEDYIREVLGVILETLGYTVTAVASGEQAVEALQGESADTPFAAAILDLTLPGGMDGKETAERLREIREDLPIFFSSGYSDDPVIADPAAFGFSGSFCKPYRLQDIEAALDRFFSTKAEA